MLAENAESAPIAVTDNAHKASFFRQSGWLMIAGVAGGMLMWLVHFLSKRVGEAEYGTFVSYLSIAMVVPGMPLQMVFAHQTAKALALNRQRQLTGMIRVVWGWSLFLWMIAAIVVFVGQHGIMQAWDLKSATGLWMTMGVVLFTLWQPIVFGLLQGKQDFFWLGWSMMSNGMGRMLLAYVVVIAVSATASSMMFGALAGMAVSTAIGAWHARSLLRGPRESFDWKELLREVIPPMLGFGSLQFLFTADTMFVKTYFSANEVGYYGGAGTLSRALMWLVTPLAAVMFPKIVHSAAKSEKTDLMGIVLLGTALLAIVGAACLSFVGPIVAKMVYKPNWVEPVNAILPWYVSAMVPMALANVLLNNLLGRSDFRVVPPTCILAIGYAFALTRFHDSLLMVIKTIGFAGVALLLISAWFTWGSKAKIAAPSPSAA